VYVLITGLHTYTYVCECIYSAYFLQGQTNTPKQSNSIFLFLESFDSCQSLLILNIDDVVSLALLQFVLPNPTLILFTKSFIFTVKVTFTRMSDVSIIWPKEDEHLSLSPAAASTDILPTCPDYSWGGCSLPLNTVVLSERLQ